VPGAARTRIEAAILEHQAERLALLLQEVRLMDLTEWLKNGGHDKPTLAG
jgi:hypothetical protein